MRYALRSLLLVATALCLGAGSAPPGEAQVRRAIDGDTIELADGRMVRYIGIDAPEVRRKEGTEWVKDPEPFSDVATAENRRLVEGQRVRLEYDVQELDRYGRLLAYVYVGETMVNAQLLRLGVAQLLTIPPNVKHAERFRALAEEARLARRGLWGTD
jgi:micrococcal nuclease